MDNPGHLVGSVAWMAPECLEMKPYDEKIDVYSYSLILWQIILHKEYPVDPNKYMDGGEVQYAVCEMGLRPEIPNNIPINIADFLKLGWAADPKERPSFTKILKKLPKLLLPFVLNSQEAAKFWINNWITGEVDYEEFYQKFFSFFSKSFPTEHSEEYVKFLCFNQLLREFCLQHVSLNSLRNIMNSFGNFDFEILDRIYEIMQHEWFVGVMTKSEVVTTLKSIDKDFFFVRINASNPETPFTLTKLKNKKISHQRIQKTLQGYTLKIKREGHHEKELIIGNSISDLIKLYEKKLKIKRKRLSSRILKYQNLFSGAKNVIDEGYMGDGDDLKITI